MASIVFAVLDKISGYLVDPIIQQCGYLIFFNSNVESLIDKMEKLENEKVGVQRRVDAATRNMEEIDPVVKAWLTHVEAVQTAGKKIIEDKAQFSKGCFNEWVLNLKSRYIISRKAKKRTQEIEELQQEKRSENVSLPTLQIPSMMPTSPRTFGSREVILNEIIFKLKDVNINMVGICGMGGVGKTTVMEEVFRELKEKQLFDDYAKTVVSEKADSIRVQNDVAEMLGLKLPENNPDLKASRMNQRLEGKKVLIVLDDVWEELDLQALGITLEGGQKRCKILYTSRSQGLWMDREDKVDVPLHVLLDNEAWNLFREKVGNFLDQKIEFQPLAREIIKECAGLPLALVTLGRALRGKSIHAWKDTLLKLRTVSGEQKVYESLKLSYDHLVDEEAKSMFLLCGMFGEDSEIFLETLIGMGMGLHLFKGIYSVEDARNRVITLVEHLNSCCLVSSLEVSEAGTKYIKIHDLVRDVSKLISSRDKGVLVVEPGFHLRGLEDQLRLENSVWLSVISKGELELPSRFKCPRLELLHCRDTYRDLCFDQMLRLKVIQFNNKHPRRYPSSVHFLTGLRTLCVIKCDCRDLTAVGNLRSLEILRISDERLQVLPKEIGYLTNLMLLDVSGCSWLKKISAGVISGLIRLEELYLGVLKIDWEGADNEEILTVRQRVSSLRVLHLLIHDATLLPRLPLVFGNLKKYHVLIGRWLCVLPGSRGCESSLAIYLDNSSSYLPCTEYSFLLQNTEVLVLKGMFTKDLAYEFIREGSHVIKHLELMDTDITESLFLPFGFSSLESLILNRVNNLRQITYQDGSFENLKDLQIKFCQQVKNIFQLSSTAISTKLEFPKLENLEIITLQSLISFCNGATEVEFHQLKHLNLKTLLRVECLFLKPSDQSTTLDSGGDPSLSIFPRKVSFPSVVKIEIFGLEKMKDIWGGKIQSGSFRNLVELRVEICGSLQKLVTPRTARYLVELQTLYLWNCWNMKEIVSEEEEDGENHTTNIFPKLKKVELFRMRALEIFCHIDHDLEFSMLEEVGLLDCPKFKAFAPGSVNTPNLHDVKYLQLYNGIKTPIWKDSLNGTIQHLYERQQQQQQQK